MHRTYVGPTSARCWQTPADIPPSSRYRPDVGMFAGKGLLTHIVLRRHVISTMRFLIDTFRMTHMAIRYHNAHM